MKFLGAHVRLPEVAWSDSDPSTSFPSFPTSSEEEAVEGEESSSDPSASSSPSCQDPQEEGPCDFCFF